MRARIRASVGNRRVLVVMKCHKTWKRRRIRSDLKKHGHIWCSGPAPRGESCATPPLLRWRRGAGFFVSAQRTAGEETTPQSPFWGAHSGEIQVMEKLQKMLLLFELHILYLQPVVYTILKLKLSAREEMDTWGLGFRHRVST